MTLIILTVAVIVLMIAVLAIFLFAIGTLLNRTSENLDDCDQNVRNICGHAKVIGPAIERINKTGATVAGALPSLCDGAERVAVAKSAPYSDSPANPPVTASAVAPSQGVGYLDRGNVGYLDV